MSAPSNDRALLNEIVSLSREYGEGHDWVIGGGGNTSIKNADWMYVKASGTTLRDITNEQFVKMSRARLNMIWKKAYPKDAEERERQALADLLGARAGSDQDKRPSVETLMHALFPHRIVVHTHPTKVNGLTCSSHGEEITARVFGDRALWIPTVNPGYILARTIYDLVEAWRGRHGGAYPSVLIMRNHGLVVVGDTAGEIRSLNSEVVRALEGVIESEPEMEPLVHDASEYEVLRAATARAVSKVGELHSPVTKGFSCPELAKRAANTIEVLCNGALSPDHIVYAGHRPCIVRTGGDEDYSAATDAAVQDYLACEGVLPKIVLFVDRHNDRDAVAVAVGAGEKKAVLAELLFLDLLKILRYAESFGGVRYMPRDQERFILNWEVEQFRERVSTG